MLDNATRNRIARAYRDLSMAVFEDGLTESEKSDLRAATRHLSYLLWESKVRTPEVQS